MFNRIGILSQGVLTSCGFSVTIVSDHGPGYLPVCSVVWLCVCMYSLFTYVLAIITAHLCGLCVSLLETASVIYCKVSTAR